MNPEKLKELQIKSAARSRPQRSLWIIFLGVAVVTGVAVYFAWPRPEDQRRLGSKESATSSTPGEPANAPTPAMAGNTSRALLTVSGYIVNRERIELSPRFMGVVKWIGVRKGDAVTNGQVVVRLDDSEQQARLSESQARLANAKVAMAKAALDYERVLQLRRAEVEARQTEDEMRLRLESAQANVREAESLVELQKTYLDWTIIRSPINGVVLEKLVDAAELVVPQSFGGGRGPSTALIALADLKDLQVEIDLSESDLAKVFLNQKCRISPEAYLDRVYDGYVAEIAPEANRQKGTLQIKVQIARPDRYLTPELSAKVDFMAGPLP
jgi:HlyD family secretion protein